MNVRDMLTKGDFNTMVQNTLDDGSTEVILRKRGDKRSYRFRARDLYGKDEQIFDEKITEAP